MTTVEEPDWLAADRQLGAEALIKQAATNSNGHATDEPPADEQSEYQDIVDAWTPINLLPVLNGQHQTPRPTLLRTPDLKHAVFYRGAVNGLHGDSGIGKSWLMLTAIVQTLAAGAHTILIDYESTPAEIVDRLRSLGANPEQILHHLTYLRPDHPTGAVALDQLRNSIRSDTELIVIDSLGEAFGVDGVDENLDAEVGPWLRRMARPLADAGPAVILIDHSTKAADNPLHPSGSKRKRAAITGASYLVTAPRPFTREQAGTLALTCAKDRHGTYARGAIALTADVTPYPDGGITVNLNAPLASARVHEVAVELAARRAIAAAKDEGNPLSMRSLTGLMQIKAGTDTKRAGIELAVARGHLRVERGPRGAALHHWVSDPPQPDEDDE